jgi:CheY-like chemotaxis protein
VHDDDRLGSSERWLGRLLEGMVQKFGYEVVTAEGGEPAAALLTGPDGAGIDCVILDLVMPDLDGLGVLARLRRDAVAAPVIVQTAHATLLPQSLSRKWFRKLAPGVDYYYVDYVRLQKALYRSRLRIMPLYTAFARSRKTMIEGLPTGV